MRRLALILLIACWACRPLVADEVPAARAYLDAVQESVTAMEKEMDALAAAADEAFARLAAGRSLGVRGGAGLAWELADRPGGLALYRGGKGEAGDVILFALDPLEAQPEDARVAAADHIADAARLRAAGSLIIGIASLDHLRELGLFDAARQACDVLIDNHAPPVAGQPSRATVVNAVVAWAWTCEVFAAGTRRELPPVMRKSLETDYRRVRHRRYDGLRFHRVAQLEPIEPGVLGRIYIRKVQRLLVDIGTASWPAIAETTHRANDALAAGGRVFIRVGGRYLAHHHAGQLRGDPGVMIGLDHDGSNPDLPQPGAGDFVIAFGYSDPPGTDWWGEPEMLREAGRGVAWVLSAYVTQPRDLQRGEIVIDQQWPIGDAVVSVPGYDVPIGATSGVAVTTIHGCLTATIRPPR